MSNLKQKLAAVALAVGTITGTAVVAAPAANAWAAYVTWHYSDTCAAPGVIYAGDPYRPYYIRRAWYKDYHRSTAELLRGLRDYSVYDHTDLTNIRCSFA
jgi:hypothetical protein